jgi:hypothetical protein
MGRFRSGSHLMSMAGAAIGGSNPGANILVATVTITSGANPESVANASGSSSLAFQVAVSGGTGPYTYSWARENGAGKVNLYAPNINQNLCAVTYDGLSVGEIDSVYAHCDVADAVGNTGSSSGANIAVRRTS